MKHIIIGLVGIILGLWGIALNWYQFLDFLWVLVPMAVLLGGIVSLLAGISNFAKGSRSEEKVNPAKPQEGVGK